MIIEMDAAENEVESYLRIILTSPKHTILSAWKKLREIANEQVEFHDLERLFQRTFYIQPYSESSPLVNINVSEVAKILEWFSERLEKTSSWYPFSDDIASFLKNINFKNNQHFMQILDTLAHNKSYSDSSHCHKNLCQVIIHIIASLPSNKERPCEISEKVKNYFDKINLYEPKRKLEYVQQWLKTLFEIISNIEHETSDANGSHCQLCFLLLYMEEESIPNDVQWIISNSKSKENLMKILRVLSIWLRFSPTEIARRITILIKPLVDALESQGKYPVSQEVFKTLIEPVKLFAVPLVFFNSLPLLVYTLKKQDEVFFEQHPDKLHELKKVLESKLSNPRPQDPEHLLHELNEIVNANGKKSSSENSQIISPVIRLYSESELCSSDSENISNPKKLPSTGKIGLFNLGNSCYMNSGLQALLMTKHFCHEVLTYDCLDKNDDKIIMKKLQQLFALLLYSKRPAVWPKEFLSVARPSYFLPGQQQDSSEFLCHLLDVLHEQERSTTLNAETVGNFERWETQEDLTVKEILIDKKKTTSLSDFTKGEENAERKQLNNSYYDSMDSGIQSVDGEDLSLQTSLVHKVFGGQSDVMYRCIKCNNMSHNIDQFRDLPLCFPEKITEDQEVSVQDLINDYLEPETLTGDNKYHCDKCKELCDAHRNIQILQAPNYLILTLKHFYYDPESRLRAKLRHKVLYNETIQLPISNNQVEPHQLDTYQLYAVVIHSGYSMDYGHYFTYARDEKQSWYKFNDNLVSCITLEDLKTLSPPDTPYILFYEKIRSNQNFDKTIKPELTNLSQSLQEYLKKDGFNYKKTQYQTEASRSDSKSVLSTKAHNSNVENPPPSACRDPVNFPHNPYIQ